MLHAVLKSLNTGFWIAAADGDDGFVGESNMEIGGQGMGCGVWDQSIYEVFCASMIADKNEYGWNPAQSDGKRAGIAAQLRIVESSTCLLDGLYRATLHPQSPRQAEANQYAIIEPKVGAPGTRPMLERSLKLRAGAIMITREV